MSGNKTHGHTSGAAGTRRQSSTYMAWYNMKARCTNINRSDYNNYGGRGITYDPKWELFENFLADMGERPESVDCYSLDRIDNNGNYSKSNCRWATQVEQNHNQGIAKHNTTGIRGVSWYKPTQSWLARGSHERKVLKLYYGKDFFEACCARKSWENNYV